MYNVSGNKMYLKKNYLWTAVQNSSVSKIRMVVAQETIY